MVDQVPWEMPPAPPLCLFLSFTYIIKQYRYLASSLWSARSENSSTTEHLRSITQIFLIDGRSRAVTITISGWELFNLQSSTFFIDTHRPSFTFSSLLTITKTSTIAQKAANRTRIPGYKWIKSVGAGRGVWHDMVMPTRSCTPDLHSPPLAQIKHHCVDNARAPHAVKQTVPRSIRGLNLMTVPLTTCCTISSSPARPAHACSRSAHQIQKKKNCGARMPAWVASTQGAAWASHVYSRHPARWLSLLDGLSHSHM